MSNKAIQEKAPELSRLIVSLFILLNQKKEFVISKQLLRSGTSVGANVEEAQAGASLKDFTGKMIIARKEARETRYWLELIRDCKIVDFDISNEINLSTEVLKLLNSIVKTCRKKINSEKK
jgi:four helix bundle protein